MSLLSLNRFLNSSSLVFQKWLKSNNHVLDVVIGNQVALLFVFDEIGC